MPFRDVIGHRQLVRLIARSIRRDSLPPSLIFAGPGGVGKRLTALATAQALNCLTPIVVQPGEPIVARDQATASTLWSEDHGSTSPPPSGIEFDACGTCNACTRISRGIHPDVLIVEPGETGSIKTDQVRDVIDRAAYRPFEGRRRVVIIDRADGLVASAQNALLKTLEEPPSSSIFILVTARPDTLLPTVLSRCPRLRFLPLGSNDVARALMLRGRDERSARAVAALADGSIGHALDMTASDLVQARAVAQQVLSSAAGRDDPRRRIDGAKDLLSNTGAGGAADRQQVASHLRAIASLVRDMELLSTGADARALANPDVRPVLEQLAPAYRGERGLRAFAAIDQALVALDRNAGVKIVADWLVLQL
jgi:DNA polymerase-3 subunit delta'